ncbi:MAG: hypothetical protein LBV30_07595 [Propionibacteriaceae bacterium]|nr:hypothetical protein [Propionibacteriaceae bacterium]
MKMMRAQIVILRRVWTGWILLILSMMLIATVYLTVTASDNSVYDPQLRNWQLGASSSLFLWSSFGNYLAVFMSAFMSSGDTSNGTDSIMLMWSGRISTILSKLLAIVVISFLATLLVGIGGALLGILRSTHSIGLSGSLAILWQVLFVTGVNTWIAVIWLMVGQWLRRYALVLGLGMIYLLLVSFLPITSSPWIRILYPSIFVDGFMRKVFSSLAYSTSIQIREAQGQSMVMICFSATLMVIIIFSGYWRALTRESR